MAKISPYKVVTLTSGHPVGGTWTIPKFCHADSFERNTLLNIGDGLSSPVCSICLCPWLRQWMDQPWVRGYCQYSRYPFLDHGVGQVYKCLVPTNKINQILLLSPLQAEVSRWLWRATCAWLQTTRRWASWRRGSPSYPEAEEPKGCHGKMG